MLSTLSLPQEKIKQAIALLNELQLDCWLIFVRETYEQSDPAFRLISDHDVSAPGAFLLTRTGERIAIVSHLDETLVTPSLYETIMSYSDDCASSLLETLQRLDPRTIAINYSLSDVPADGLTHGMYLKLQDILKESPLAERLISAGPLIARLRSRKTTEELARMRRAIEETERLFELIGQTLRSGVTEREVAEVVHAAIARASLGPAWYSEVCPGVKFGPETAFGHGVPGDIALEAGFVVSVDLGVRYQGYCSDLQRIWYVRQAGERHPPVVVQRAFGAVKGAIDAARAVLRPGVAGWQVDAAAREYLVRAGYPEYQHALGHGVGRQVHDGGPLLGPRKARYGEMPDAKIEEGMVLTLEPGIGTERGYVSQEDEVLVTASGCEWLSHPQEAIYLV